MTIQLERYVAPKVKKSVPTAPEFTGQSVKHPYYDFGPLLSHNAVYNFCIGGRGLGKTYGAKRRAIQRFIKHGEMFIYLRRYKEELISRETFFSDIQHEFPQWDFRANGNTFESAPASTREDKRRPWSTMGYAIALSTAQKQKSVAFPRVKTIIFDEFIIEKGVVRYLPDEANVFNNFYSTVDRWQDKTKVFFLANSVSINNPYFLNLNIIPDSDEEWIKGADGFYIVHMPHSSEFAASVLATRFGRFIADTDYAEYAVGNQFSDNHGHLVGVKNPNAVHMFNLEVEPGKCFSVWQDVFAGEYYAARRLPGNQLTFTLVPENVTEDKTLIQNNDRILDRLRTKYSHSRIKFDTPATRNMFIILFKRR